MNSIFVALIAFLAGSSLASAGPLHDAASAGDVGKVGALLDQGAEIDARNEKGETPLILTILAAHDAVAELLIERGAAVEGRNAGGFTPLHAAAYIGDVAIADLLIERGANVNDAHNKDGVTPLFPAIEEDHKAMTELLLARGADPGLKERHGYTPLTRALFKGNEDVVVALRAHGAECQSDVLSESQHQACLAAGR